MNKPSDHDGQVAMEFIALLNQFPLEKLPLLARRILQSTSRQHLFTIEEENQLMQMSSMSVSQIRVFLSGLSQLFLSAVYEDLDEEKFQRKLHLANANESIATSLANIWSLEHATYRESLVHESTTVQLPNVVESNWRLHVSIADNSSSGQAIPNAVFNLKTNTDTEINMAMNHSEMLQFLIQLDTIQAQLDTLAAP